MSAYMVSIKMKFPKVRFIKIVPLPQDKKKKPNPL